MTIATLCFLLKDNKICLGLKKRGFGKDKYNGFGGKVGDKKEFKSETVDEAIKREGNEEFGIEVQNLKKVGEILFKFVHNPTWDHLVHVYISNKWIGEPKEGEEMAPEWFELSQIPYDKMWDDDKYWLPKVLEGKKIKAKFEFDQNDIVISQQIKTL